MGHGEGHGKGQGEGHGEGQGEGTEGVLIGGAMACCLTVCFCLIGIPMIIAGAILVVLG